MSKVKILGKLGEAANALLLAEVSYEAGKATGDVSGQARNGDCAVAWAIF